MTNLPSKSKPHKPARLPATPGYRLAEVGVRGVPVLLKYSARIYRGAVAAALRGKRAEFPGLTRDFFAEANAVNDRCMEFMTQSHGEFTRLQPDERGIVIGNHPSDALLWTWMHQVTDKFSPDMVGIVKKEFMYAPHTLPPILGWPAKLGSMMVTIDRSNKESAIASLRIGMENIFSEGKSVFVFPEGHRPTREKIENSQEYYDKKFPKLDVNNWMTETCFPKSGALFEVLAATSDTPTRILNTTISADVPEGDPELIGASVDFYAEEVSREDLVGESDDPEEQEQHLRRWLVKEWQRKNATIRRRHLR